MAILEEEKKKFFDFIDSILKGGSSGLEDKSTELEDMKTDGGVQYPKEAYLYVPDASKPSTWKLRIWETPSTKVTRRQLGRAAAAFSAGGFRGQKVDLPSGEVASIKAKLVSLYKKDGATKDEIPNYLLEEGGGDDMALEDKMTELEKKLQELTDIRAKEKKELEEAATASMEAMKKELSETHKKELEESNRKLEDAEKKLSERDKELHKEKVEKKCSDLIDNGIWPSVVEKVKKVMLVDVDKAFSSIKLDEKTEVSLSEMLCDILETIPTEARINLDELGHVNKNTDPNKKFMSEKEVEEYAKENKLSYQDACSVLGKEGKIEL